MMLIALYSAAAAWILLDRRKVLTRAVIGACAVAFGVSLTWNVLERSRPAKQGELEIFFLDVGDADAMFVRLPDGRTLLVDAAGRFSESFDVGKAVVVPFLETQWIRRLDYALLTHPERDHAGGLLAVLGQCRWGSSGKAACARPTRFAAGSFGRRRPARCRSIGSGAA
jgi:competence protein ComEC